MARFGAVFEGRGNGGCGPVRRDGTRWCRAGECACASCGDGIEIERLRLCACSRWCASEGRRGTCSCVYPPIWRRLPVCAPISSNGLFDTVPGRIVFLDIVSDGVLGVKTARIAFTSRKSRLAIPSPPRKFGMWPGDMFSSLGVGEGKTVTAEGLQCGRSWPVKILASWGEVELEGGCVSAGGSMEGRAASTEGSGARIFRGRPRGRGAEGKFAATSGADADMACVVGIAAVGVLADCIQLF
jgi:hypothetical protein